MILFHVHKGGIRVCFGKAVAAAEGVLIRGIFRLLGFQPPKSLNISLQFAPSMTTTMNKGRRHFRFQRRKQVVPLQNSVFLAKLRRQLLQSGKHPAFIFVGAFLPNEAVFVGICLNFSSIHEQMIKFDFSDFMELLHELNEQRLCTFGQTLASESGNFVVAWRLFSVSQPDKVEISDASCCNFTGTVYALHIGV